MTVKKYNEADAYAAFKVVRNRLRRHYPHEIILKCIEILNNRKAADIKMLTQYPPWSCLLLIKWASLFGEYLSPERKPLNNQDFDYLLKLMYDLQGKMRLPNQYENFFLFFRNLAFQQFWFQEDISSVKIARQSLLFAGLDENHFFTKTFTSKFDISISEFIDIEFMILTKFITLDELSITEEWFKFLKDKYPKDFFSKILNQLSLSLNELQTYFEKIQQNKKPNVSYEFYEQTPLKTHPFLQFNNSYICLCRQLLYQCFQNFIYDTLRWDDPQKFMDKFGKIFENYVRKLLEYSDLSFIDEKDIKALLPLESKSIDFLISDDNVNLLIDAKGVEVSYLGMVSHKAEVISDKIKSSVLKGIRQSFETTKNLCKTGYESFNKSDCSNNFLFIVTYKDLFIGNGTDFYQYLAKERLEKIINENENKIWIPFENMYFISIDDLEFLIEYIRDGDSTLSETLRKIVEIDSNNQSKKLILRQHLYGFSENLLVPKIIQNEFELIYNRLKSKIN